MIYISMHRVSTREHQVNTVVMVEPMCTLQRISLHGRAEIFY